MSRVTTPDLKDPVPLRPPPTTNVVFKTAAKPIVGNDLGRLADALGTFNKNLSDFTTSVTDAERERAKKDIELRIARVEADADPSRRRASWDQMAASGDFQGPIARAALDKAQAKDEAEAIVQQLRKDVQDGKVPLGEDGFSPENHVAERMASLTARYSNSVTGLRSIENEAVRAALSLRNDHDKLVFQRQDKELLTTAGNLIADEIDKAVNAGPVDGQTLSDTLRKVMREVGPRSLGGSLDIGHKRLDGLLLGILEKRAAIDPRIAAVAPDLLRASRVDEKGNKLRSFDDTLEYQDVVKHIQDVSLRALGKDWKDRTEARLSGQLADAALRADGSLDFLTNIDDINPYTGEKFSKSITEQRKIAFDTALRTIQSEAGNKVDFEREYKLFVMNNEQHPQWKAELEGGFKGASSPDALTTPGGMKRVLTDLALYRSLADRHQPYVDSLLSKEARDWYQTVNALTQTGGLSPQQALMDVAAAQQEIATKEGSEMFGKRRDAVASAVRGMDFNGWFPGNKTPENQMLLQNRVIDYADALVKVRGITPEAAIKEASKAVESSAVIVNGRAIIHPGLVANDTLAVTRLLGDFYKQNEKFLKGEGVSSPEDISMVPRRGGVFQPIHAKTGVPLLIKMEKDGVPTLGVPSLSLGDIRKTQADIRSQEEQAALAEKITSVAFRKQLNTPENTSAMDVAIKSAGNPVMTAIEAAKVGVSLFNSAVGGYDKKESDSIPVPRSSPIPDFMKPDPTESNQGKWDNLFKR